jgi:hypothetical protein
MDNFYENRVAGSNRGGDFARGLPARLLELLAVLVADVSSDVEVVARELTLKDEMRERLRRPLDQVGCARVCPGSNAGDRGSEVGTDDDGSGGRTRQAG